MAQAGMDLAGRAAAVAVRGPVNVWAGRSKFVLVAVLMAGLGIQGCGLSGFGEPATSARVVPLGAPIPKGGGVRKIGSPYTIDGVTFIPRAELDYDRVGVASWYGVDYHGRRTANGEIYDMYALTGAHPTLPMPSFVRVTNLATGAARVIRINDRGPFVNGRILDVSLRVAQELGFAQQGLTHVRVQYIGPAPL